MVNLNSTVAEGGEGKGNTLAIVAALAILAGAGYYFLVYKPEQEEKEKLK